MSEGWASGEEGGKQALGRPKKAVRERGEEEEGRSFREHRPREDENEGMWD